MHRFLPMALAVLLPVAGMRLAHGQPAAASAEMIFQTRCATCHSVARAVRPLRAMSPSDRQKRLGQFLANHHLPDASERAILIEYLLAAASA